jgi:hypothetical protein
MTFSIVKIKRDMAECCYAEYCKEALYAECPYDGVVMLRMIFWSVIMLIVFMQNVIMQCVITMSVIVQNLIMLNVIMLNVIMTSSSF